MPEDERRDEITPESQPYEPPAVEDLEAKDAPLVTAPGAPPRSSF